MHQSLLSWQRCLLAALAGRKRSHMDRARWKRWTRLLLALIIVTTALLGPACSDSQSEPAAESVLEGDVSQAWVAVYDSPWHQEDEVEAMGVDAAGNVYVTGSSATIMYSPDGDEMWVNPSGGFSKSIAVDGLGNVYVTGMTTIKYDGDGKQCWARKHTGPDDWADVLLDLAVDGSGNVYVTGYNQAEAIGEKQDYVTIKYDTAGKELWVARYDGTGSRYDMATNIAVDRSGNVYVTGYSYCGSYQGHANNDYATVKYDPAGNQLWVARYDGPSKDSYPSSDNPTAMVVDTSGSVYVTGYSEDDYATLKYDSEGNQLWLARYDGPTGEWDCAEDMAVDDSGNVYVIGGSCGDYRIIKYDKDGNELWVALLDGPRDHCDFCAVVAVDGLGNAYVTAKSGSDYTTVKYDSHGNQLWSARYDTGDSEGPSALHVDSAGNVYVAGWSDGNYVTIKYTQGIA